MTFFERGDASYGFVLGTKKLFDFIHARVPLVASDLPFLRQVIMGHGLGAVARLDRPAAYAEAIMSVLGHPEQRPTWRARSSRVAARRAWAADPAAPMAGSCLTSDEG